jgi:hypothetical protein
MSSKRTIVRVCGMVVEMLCSDILAFVTLAHSACYVVPVLFRHSDTKGIRWGPMGHVCLYIIPLRPPILVWRRYSRGIGARSQEDAEESCVLALMD